MSARVRGLLRGLRCVQAGWAFGVPEDGREQWLELVAAAVAGPVLGELDEDGRLADTSGHGLWMIAAWLPEGREGEAARLLAAHGVEVYRMWRPEGDAG